MLQSILNISLSQTAWNQVTFPGKLGGIGIRMATQIALAAFLSSVKSSSDLGRQLLPPRLNSTNGVDDLLFTSAVDEWMVQTVENNHSQLTIIQKAWAAPLVSIDRERVLFAASNQAGIARLIAATVPYSGDFRHALLCSAVCTRLEDMSLRIAIAV
jgi:hypothetical protein